MAKRNHIPPQEQRWQQKSLFLLLTPSFLRTISRAPFRFTSKLDRNNPWAGRGLVPLYRKSWKKRHGGPDKAEKQGVYELGVDPWDTGHLDCLPRAPAGPWATTEERKNPGPRGWDRGSQGRPQCWECHPPSLGAGRGGGAWNSAQETFYSLWTSRSAEKVDEQLVTRAQGTPAAIAEPAIRFGLQASSALGDTMAAVAQGRRARKARSQKARPALPPFHPPLPLPSWTGPRCALGCHGNELPLRRINVPRNRASSAR